MAPRQDQDLALVYEREKQKAVRARTVASSCQKANSVFQKILNCLQKMCYAPSLASNNAQDRMFIDSSEVLQHVTALCLAINMTLPNE